MYLVVGRDPYLIIVVLHKEHLKRVLRLVTRVHFPTIVVVEMNTGIQLPPPWVAVGLVHLYATALRIKEEGRRKKEEGENLY